MNNPAEAETPTPADQRRSPLCQSCQRITTVDWHTTATDVFDVESCTQQAGDGVWLCGVCHRSVHEHMDAHPEDGCAAVSLLRLTERLAAIVRKKPRPYERKKPQEPQEPEEDGGP